MGAIFCEELSEPNGVTIGIPVYNEQERIERAVRSAAGQCERLIVSDNASNDNTELICRRLLLEFPNMEYKRHESNIGSLKNFHSILALVETPYFMFLGSHDSISSTFIVNLKKELSENPDVVLCAGALYFLHRTISTKAPQADEEFNNWKGGEQADSAARVRSLLYADANLPWIMYGLFRTALCKELFNDDLPTYNVDLILLAKIVYRGKVKIIEKAKYFAFVGVEASRPNYVTRLTGKGTGVSSQRLLRNISRQAIYNILNKSEDPRTFIDRLSLRYKVMARFGVFKFPGFDTPYLLFFMPAKVAISIRRFIRSLKKYRRFI